MSQQINLFNPIFMKQRKYLSLLTMVQAAALIVLGSLVFFGYAKYQVGRMAVHMEENERRYVSEQERLAKFKAEFSPQFSQQSLQFEVQALEKALAEQTRTVETLNSGVIGNTTGYSQYMRAFARQSVQGLWLTGFHLVGDATQISLSGGVLSPELLPQYIQRLGRENTMNGKSFATLQMQQGDVPLGKDGKPVTSTHYVLFSVHSTPDEEAK